MDLELAGRTALVIGGSSGIGADLADVLAQEGCDVAVTYRASAGHAEQAITFVASPVNEFMTGATIDVNSGRLSR